MTINEIHEYATKKVIGLLRTGMVPWIHPWTKCSELPQNALTRRPYRNGSAFLLSTAGFDSPYWLTRSQVKALGGSVRRKEAPERVIYWQWKGKGSEVTERTHRGFWKEPRLGCFEVYNVRQCRNLDDLTDYAPITIPPAESVRLANDIINNMPRRPEIRRSKRCSYHRVFDQVTVMSPRRYDSHQHYYGTIFHELIHSTGHAERLARHHRFTDGLFSGEKFSREELIADMGTALLAQKCGMTDLPGRHDPAYIEKWIERLTEDHRLFLTAASQAQRAVDYITGTTVLIEGYPEPVETEKNRQIFADTKN